MPDLLILGATWNAPWVTDRPEADAILVRNGLVIAVGPVAEIAPMAAPNAERVDLDGATVLPGLIESHVHPAYTGLTDLWADCRSSRVGSIADLQAALGALSAGDDAWTRGWGYDDTLLAEGRHPTRDELDQVSLTSPVIVSHILGTSSSPTRLHSGRRASTRRAFRSATRGSPATHPAD